MIVAVVGISFAAFTYSSEGQKENTISTGTVTMAYNEPENGINIENAIPMTSDEGKKLTGANNVFDFNVSATITGKTTINYAIVAEKQEGSTISDNDIRLYLEESKNNNLNYQPVFDPKKFSADDSSDYGAPIGTMQLFTGSFINNNENGNQAEFTNYYRLRMWVAQDYQLTETAKTYSVKVNVYGKGQD